MSKSLQVHPFFNAIKIEDEKPFYLVTVNIIQIKLTLIGQKVSTQNLPAIFLTAAKSKTHRKSVESVFLFTGLVEV